MYFIQSPLKVTHVHSPQRFLKSEGWRLDENCKSVIAKHTEHLQREATNSCTHQFNNPAAPAAGSNLPGLILQAITQVKEWALGTTHDSFPNGQTAWQKI